MDKGASSTLPSNLQATTQGAFKSLVQHSTEQHSQNQSLRQSFSHADIDDPWVAGYDAAERCSETDYRNASGK
jgi:hypothetical protein